MYKKRKMLANGRSSSSGAHAQLPCPVLKSQAYIDLSPGAKNVLVALAAQYRGSNNGDLSLSLATLSPYGIKSPDTIWRAEKQLRANRLIFRTRVGQKYRNMPNLYAITWRPIDPCDEKTKGYASKTAGNQWREYNGTPLPLEGYDEGT